MSSRRMHHRLSAVPLAVVLVLLAAWPASAADFTVDRTDDVAGGTCPSVCTLRNAVNGAQGDTSNTITVPAGTYTLTSSITIPKTITINGAGASSTTITGNNTFRIFSVAAEHRLFLSGVTVAGGNATTDTANPYGGNILVASGAWLVVANSRITGGSAPSGGGGIALRGAVIATFSSSVIDNNTTTGSGGGILAQPLQAGGNAGALGLADSTVAFNTGSSGGGIASRDNASAVSLERVTVSDNRSSSAAGGGLFTTPAQANFTVKSSIVARNSATNGRTGITAPSDCAPFAPTNSGQNVESGSDCGFTNGSQNADAGLAAQLATVNGTYVLPLLAGSPAIDRAVDCGTGTQDQTGTPRPVGVACDSGAFEYVPPPPAEPTATPSPQPTVSPTPTAHPHTHADPDAGLQQDRGRRHPQRDDPGARPGE